MPRSAAILLVFFLGLGVVVGISATVIPRLVVETKDLAEKVPVYRDRIVNDANKWMVESRWGQKFKDAWATTHPDDLCGGLTWGHDEWLADPGTSFIWQLDHVFYRGAGLFAVETAASDMVLNRISPPLWASDHAAFEATFVFQRPAPSRTATATNRHAQ